VPRGALSTRGAGRRGRGGRISWPPRLAAVVQAKPRQRARPPRRKRAPQPPPAPRRAPATRLLPQARAGCPTGPARWRGQRLARRRHGPEVPPRNCLIGGGF
jgi:hypothetical protein